MGRPRRARLGLAPHSRGSLAPNVQRLFDGGSIPALAGKPPKRRAVRQRSGVYPRTRGEAFRRPTGCVPSWGLSPHSRGSRVGVQPPARREGSIPALAGKPRPTRSKTASWGVYPRTRGEAGATSLTGTTVEGLSPHSRGSRRWDRAIRTICGSIPALAGKPESPAMTATMFRVYPRTRGEASDRVANDR